MSLNFKWKKCLKIVSLGLFSISLFLFFNTGLKTEASSSGQIMDEQKAGLQSAPSNLGLDPNMFNVANFNSFQSYPVGTKNTAGLVSEDGWSPGLTTDPMAAIRMTNSTDQAAAIWSTLNNAIDITKKQTMSMWLYFGPSTHKDGTGFGDGLAFVAQKSPDTINAFAHDSKGIGTGEALGVWGVDNDPSTSSTQAFAGTAIQNSWALEFDTHSNTSTGAGGGGYFDHGVQSGSHIAYAYPAEQATYAGPFGSKPFFNPFNGSLISGGYYYGMNHNGYQSATLHDGKWHHLTIEWQPAPKYQFTYWFDDKEPKTNKKLDNPLTASVAGINADHFGGKANLKDGKMHWGFTATTGADYETNLIALESVPASVEGDVDNEIYDETQAKTVASNGTVNSGDQLDFRYTLTYDSGRDAWKNISTKLQQADNLTYKTPGTTDGQIGHVEYDDGTTEPIYTSEIKPDEDDDVENYPDRIQHVLSKSLSSTGPKSATVVINATANNVNSDTPVASTVGHFDSDTIIKDTYTNPFVIKKAKPINLTLDQSNISVEPNKDANITGTVSYTDGTAITNSGITVHATLNGTALSNFTMDNSEAAGHLNFNIPAAKLTEEKNSLEVYVQDSNGNRSTTSTVLISKKGSLALRVNDYSFGSVNST